MNEELFKRVFDEYYKRLCFFGSRYLYDREDVRDVVMDAFAAVWKKKLEFADDLSLGSFLYTSVYNGSMNRIRQLSRQNKRYAQISQVAVRFDENPYTMDRIEDELMWALLTAIEQLPEKCARIFKMSYLDGMSIGDISVSLGISEHTVKAQRARGKKLLKDKLGSLYSLFSALFLV